MLGPIALLMSGAAAGAAAVMLLQGGGDGARPALKDVAVTALKLAREAGRMAAEAAEAVEDFVAEVAHDLASATDAESGGTEAQPRREPEPQPKARRKRTAPKSAAARPPKRKRGDSGG